MAAFGEKLRELREDAKLTQDQLAEKSGLPVGSIRNYEQGQRQPQWQVIFKLAKAMGVGVESFADIAFQPFKAASPPSKRKRKKR